MKLTAIIFMAILLLIGGILLWDFTASFRGELAAKMDLRRGRHELLFFGLPLPWRGEYAQLLEKRYGIKVRVVAGCVVSKSQVSYVEAYDKVSMAAAKQQFGHDIFEETANEARLDYESYDLNPY